MTDLRFAAFRYPRSENLGDDIQTLAGQQHLPRVDLYIDRDDLNRLSDAGPLIAMMNGWYLQAPSHWPPSANIAPILTGVHITSTNDSRQQLLHAAGLEWFAKHQPVGCRDQSTRQLLQRMGIAAEYVGCPTLTFPNRGEAPNAKKVFLVQMEGIVVPRSLAHGAIKLHQRVQRWSSPSTRRILASELLSYYRDNARLVITTKLHCALPCAAMGIPVILFADPEDPRMTPAEEAVGINPFVADRFASSLPERARRRQENRRIAREVDWSPGAPDLESIKERIVRDIHDRTALAIERLSQSE